MHRPDPAPSDAGDERAPRVAAALMTWYAAHRRDLPWRQTSDAYRVWVSEIMLQQTQVATVIPYYERFLARFPTVESLAAADLDEVLALWQGLGYYARGRNLHTAAIEIVARHGGELPRTREALLALPGIGDYTAGAILSIAFGQDEPAVDANITRVLARLLDYDRDPTTTAAKRTFRQGMAALFPPARARGHSAAAVIQAMMDLGSTICTSRAPQCKVCPLAALCLAKAHGVVEERPLRKVRAERPHRTLGLAVAGVGPNARGGRLLLVRRVPRGLLGGLWELPGCEAPSVEALPAALERDLAAHLGLTLSAAAHHGAVEHGYSHFTLTAHLYVCQIEGEPTPDGPWDQAAWLAPEELADYGLTGLTTKALASLQSQPSLWEWAADDR